MAKYFGKRLVIGLITLFALATITFFLMHAIPGSPFSGETSKLPANVKEKLVEQYGLDKPVTEIRRPVSIKLPAKVYHRYFANTAAKDVQSILEEALDLYFERKGA